MSGTTKQRAIHEIRLGAPKKNGEPNIVKPKEVFDCPNDDLEWLQDQGACVDLDEADVASAKKKAAAATDPNAGGGDDDEAKAEAERLELLKEAKGLKIKGIRKDFSAETLREKIAEHKAAQAGDDDGDGDDDENAGDGDDENAGDGDGDNAGDGDGDDDEEDVL
jgi:hypothetical protein